MSGVCPVRRRTTRRRPAEVFRRRERVSCWPAHRQRRQPPRPASTAVRPSHHPAEVARPAAALLATTAIRPTGTLLYRLTIHPFGSAFLFLPRSLHRKNIRIENVFFFQLLTASSSSSQFLSSFIFPLSFFELPHRKYI